MSDPHARLIRDLIARTDGEASLIGASWRSWHSATFDGARHMLLLSAPRSAAGWLGEQIGEMEFVIPGHIVADIALTAMRPADGRIELVIEALTVKAC